MPTAPAASRIRPITPLTSVGRSGSPFPTLAIVRVPSRSPEKYHTGIGTIEPLLRRAADRGRPVARNPVDVRLVDERRRGHVSARGSERLRRAPRDRDLPEHPVGEPVEASAVGD